MATFDNTALIAIIIFLSFFLLNMRRNPMGKLETDFQGNLIKEIEKTFDGSIVTKLDANYIEGIPDLLILHKNRWATLECKKSKSEVSKKRRNKDQQDYYVAEMNNMSFSRYVYPENKEEVLNELKVHFQ